MLTFGRQLMALITASLALIVVLNPITSASAKPLHFGIFELSDVSGRDFPNQCQGKGSKAVIVTARSHPCRCLHVSRLVTQRSFLPHLGSSVNTQDNLECRTATATRIQVKIDSRLA